MSQKPRDPHYHKFTVASTLTPNSTSLVAMFIFNVLESICSPEQIPPKQFAFSHPESSMMPQT